MVNYNRTETEKTFNRITRPQQGAKEKLFLIFLFLLALIPAVLSSPAPVLGMGKKIAVLPFKIESAEPTGSLNKNLQNMISQDMSNLGYEVISNELINSILGDHISYSQPEKEIIPLGKANNADWIIIGEMTQKEESIQLNVKVLNPVSEKTPFSVMMIENDRKNLPAAIRKIAESLSDQVSKNILISDISVKGNVRASDDAIRNIIESQKGDPFDQEKLDRDLRTIYKMGIYDDVNVETSNNAGGKSITFNLVEKPTIIKIEYSGNKAKKDDKLSEELGLKVYSVLNRSEVKQSINRLLEYYRESGYYDVKIDGKIKRLSDNEVTLTYVIDEGEKVYIKEIKFKGNKVFKSDDLRDLMLTKEKTWLSWFTDSGVLDKKKLEYDIHQITVFYDNHGYIKARVGDPEITYDKEKEGLIIVINIVEGEPYVVNEISFEGDLLIPEGTLRSIVDIKKGDPFSRQNVYTESEKIKDLYADMGYAYTEVRNYPSEVEGSNLINVTLKIEKNKRVKIERINIYGNEVTKDKVLRRELRIAEGDYYSGIGLKASEARLERLDIFEDQEIKKRKGSSDDQMIIDIEGNEQLQRSISFSAGYGGYEGFMVMLQYENDNMGGRGQNFALEAMMGGSSTRFNATLTDPWLFDKPVRGSLTLYNWDMDYDNTYSRKRTGGNAGLAFLLGLDDFTRGTVQYTYDDSYVSQVYSTSPLILDMIGRHKTSSVTVGIERNSQNRPWDTTSGSLNAFTFEYSGGFLGGSNAFNKYILSSTWYIPEFKGTVLVASAQLGYVQKRSGGDLPLYEKFRLGGIDSVRGYEWGTISPLDPETGDEINGDTMWLYRLEYRIPFAKGQQGIWGLFFFDAGNAFDWGTSWKKGAGSSVGFGVRWRSPMGPLRLEYGFKLNDRVNDTDSGKFEFKIGGSF